MIQDYKMGEFQTNEKEVQLKNIWALIILKIKLDNILNVIEF